MANNYDNELHFIKSKNYMEILHYINKTQIDFYKLRKFISNDEYKIITEITKKNPVYLELINKINELFKEFRALNTFFYVISRHGIKQKSHKLMNKLVISDDDALEFVGNFVIGSTLS